MGESMGKLFSGLTKTEVQNDGKSSLYNNPASAGMAIADAVRRTAEPATSNVQGELTPPTQGVSMLPGPVNASVPDITPSGDNTSVSMNQPAIAAPPMMKKTSFEEAASTSPNKLTTKGTVLRLLLESGLGAAAGAGSRTVGEGSARALQAQKARSDLVTQGNEQEQQRANLADLPGDKARAVAHTEAVTALANAQRDSLKPVMVNGLPVAQKQLGTVVASQLSNATKQNIADNKPQAPVDVAKQYQAAVAKAGPNAATDPDVQRLGQSLDFINKHFPKGSLDSQLADAYRRGDAKDIAILDQVVKTTRTEPRVAMVDARPVNYTDPETGAEYLTRSGTAEKEGLLRTTGANLQKNAFSPAAIFKDIDRASAAVNKAIGAYDGNDSQRGMIITALHDGYKEKPGILGEFRNSKVFTQMNPESRDLVAGVLSMREQIMGINQKLTGSATSSDVRTAAIWNTLPNGSEPDSDMARRKMNIAGQMIDNLREGFPMMKLVDKAQGAKSGAKATHRFNPATGQIEAINGK